MEHSSNLAESFIKDSARDGAGQVAASRISGQQAQANPFAGFTREQFLGNPTITKDANSATLQPRVLKTVATEEPEATDQTQTPEFKRLSTLLGSDSSARDMMTASSQTFVNSLKRDAEAISNFLKSKPFGSKPSGSIDIPSSVVPHVLSVTDNEQVLGAIVRSIPVDVMDFLGRKKLSPEHLLRDQSMLEDVLAVNGKSSVSLGINKAIAGSLMGSVADTAAEISNLASRSLKGDSAGLTGANNSVLGAQNGTPSNGLGGIKDITKSKSFLNWFGNSKVVDAEGKPLVVYHGTARDFAEFKSEAQGDNFGDYEGAFPRDGFWFTSDPSNAHWYANVSANGLEGERAGGGQKTIPAYLSIKNPYRYTVDMFADEGESGIPSQVELEAQGYDGIIVEIAEDDDGSTVSTEAEAMWEEYTPIHGAPINWPADLRAQYNDLLDVPPTLKYTHYVAFRPEQIKSAIWRYW